MAGLLAYGNLEDYLDREFKRQVEERLAAGQQEVGRHNQAEENIQHEQIAENAALRKAQQDDLAYTRQQNILNQQRDDIRAGAELRAPGMPVTPEERSREMGVGMMPSALYKQTSQYQGMSGDDASEPVGQDMFQWVGKPKSNSPGQTQVKPYSYNGQNIMAQETPEGRVMFQGRDITDEPTLKPYQAPDRMLVPVQQGDGSVVLTPRGGAAGKQAPIPGAEQSEVKGLDFLDGLVDETLNLGKQSGWKGVGPIKGGVLGPIHDYTGIDLSGEGTEGQTLRSKIEQIRTESSFAQGGKNLTPTERAALDSFLATVTHDPATAQIRLEEYQKESRKRRASILPGGGSPNGKTGGGTNTGGGRVIRYDMDGNPIQQ